MATAQLNLKIVPTPEMESAAEGLYRMYLSYLNVGFEKDQALALVITMLTIPQKGFESNE